MIPISACFALSTWTLALVASVVRLGTGSNLWEL